MTMISSLKSEYHVTNFSSHMSTNEECPNTRFYLVRMRENTDQKKLSILTLFTELRQLRKSIKF